MSERVPSQVKATLTPSFTPLRSGLLQRKCVCGNSSGLTQECAECGKIRMTGQRHQANHTKPSTVPAILHEARHSPGDRVDPARALMKPGFRHNFSRVAVGIQTKLAIGEQGDMYEQEADRMADQVTRMPTPSLQKKSYEDSTKGAARPDFVEGGSRNTISRKADQSGQAVPDDQAQGGGSGQPLDRATRDFFEPRFGHDFGHVRLHTDGHAAETSARLGALAVTIGPDIWFGSRQYRPDTAEGKKLLAHELTHVIQQDKSTSPARANHPASPGAASKPLAASLSAAPTGQAQAAPAVTGVTLPAAAEVGIGAGGSSLVATPVVAGNPAITWTLVGAPAGVTRVAGGPGGRRATIRAATAAAATAGTNFRIQAALTATPGDNFTSLPITLVGIASVTLTPAPAFAARAIAGGAVAPPAAPAVGGLADPNRDGLAGNTANAVVVTAPAGRPNTVSLTRALGASVSAAVITPGRTTGVAQVRATDNATRSRLDVPLTIQAVPQRVGPFGVSVAQGPYGSLNPMSFTFSDAGGSSPNRAVAETITAGARDDLNFLAGFAPNPAPIPARTAAANFWRDQVVTPAGAAAGAAGDANLINVNRYVGPGVPQLPRISIDRQGFQYQGWGGVFSGEIDHGIHRVTLFGAPGAFQFRSEHIFPGGRAAFPAEGYVGPPLITLTAPVVNTAAVPAAPLAAGGLAADGAALAGATVVPAVAGRTVNWSIPAAASIAFTVPAIGVAAAAAAPATIQAGLVPGTFRIRVADTVFPNRRVEGNVRVVAVRLRGIIAPVRVVPVGTLTAIVNVTADPGGRVINWTVDPASAASVGVVGTPVLGAAAAASARSATVTRLAGFTGRVTVTAADSIRPAARDSIVITFR